MRIAIVRRDKCKGGSDCPYYCIKACPVNRSGPECITAGQDKKILIDESLCIGCGICIKKCPYGAIDIINLPAELKQKPIHKYGKNEFQLFNLPVPLFGKVVGILGKNGIGKSTAVKILAGILKPNFGEKKDATYDELIQYFKGTEAQIYFEKLKKGEIKVAYKPQAVDLIPKQFEGTVRHLLVHADEKKQLKEIAEKLELTNILDNDIKEISGGELQRVAIAATVLKDANVYFFDEPTSYLDIKQRIKVSQFIKSMANEGTAVMVVEHDLIIMDYLTDLVHIIYGKEGGYGIVSLPRTTRVGINVYLDGYIKEENVRFRDYPIRFLAKEPVKIEKSYELTSWTELKKKLGKFSLDAKPGSIMKTEVVGILGENGIGKTTFVKILAGVHSPDSGEIGMKVRVSYKPQYINTDSDELVMTVLRDAIAHYDVLLIRPLDLQPLFTKKLNELSGGELQRVSVAAALSKEADLFLLDEPSAYLDVEQRLIVSKVIREIMEHKNTACLVVDHDLLFLDYLSDRLMVFSGAPAISGIEKGPYTMKEGMNLFLTDIDITMRRDIESKRPRINKPGSQKDTEQKDSNTRYYT